MPARDEAFRAALHGAPLEESLGVLARGVVHDSPSDVRCAFYIVDPSGSELSHVVGMPDSYAECVDGFAIGPDSLACGLAVNTGEPVLTPDVLEEPRWQDWRWLAKEHGFRACWSFPIETTGGNVVGTFAMYHREPQRARTADRRAASLVTSAAAIIIARQQELEERTHSELLLRESEEEYRHLFETMGQGFAQAKLIRDREGNATDYRIVKVNPAFERLLGLPLADVVGRTAREIMPELEDWWIETFDRIVRDGKPERFEHELGAVGRWYDVFACSRGSDAFTVLYEDITERKRVESEIRASNDRRAFLLELEDALRPLADPAAAQDTASRLLAQRLGTTRAMYGHIEGETGNEIAVIHGQYAGRGTPFPEQAPLAAFGRELADNLRCGETIVVDDVAADARLDDAVRAAYRSAGFAAVVAYPLVKQRRWLATFAVHDAQARRWTEAEVQLLGEVAERTWDATERIVAEQEAQAARQRRDELEREFIANAAHEIRTPLAAIVACVEALDDGAKNRPAQRDRFLGHLRREATRLARLADSLLLLARVDAEAEIPRKEVGVPNLLEAVAEQVRGQARVPVTVDAAPGLTAMSNEGLLERAILNLSENAARYTDRGEIELHARRDGRRLVIEVRDTGPGLPKGAAGRVFDRFYRGGARTANGFGLGLSIAKQVAAVLGGTLELEPHDGGGTVARLALPDVDA